MRSYSRRLLLFGILAIAVVAELAVLTVGLVGDPRPSTAAGGVTTTVPDEPQPIETAHSRELTRILEGSVIVPNSTIRLRTPFRWQPSRYQGVDYGETYSASGALVDERGNYQGSVLATVGRLDRDKLAELFHYGGQTVDPGACHPPARTPGLTCVERVLTDGTKASVSLFDERRSADLNAVRPDGSGIQLFFRTTSGGHFDGEVTFDVDTLIRFAELPGFRT